MVDTKITTSSKVQADLPPNWHPTDKFTGDEMIEAYFLGKQAGWDEKFKIINNQFKKNIDKAVEISEDLYKEVIGKTKFTLKSIHLKSDGLSKFTALFITSPLDYVSDEFLSVNDIARMYSGQKKSDDVYMSFLFMPDSEFISQDCLTADGFFLRYDKSK